MMKSRGCIGETRRDQQEPSLEGEECGPEGPWGPFREDWGGMNRSRGALRTTRDPGLPWGRALMADCMCQLDCLTGHLGSW